MAFWSKFFPWHRVQERSIKECLTEISVGSLVSIDFKTPEEIGIAAEYGLSVSRLNPKEASVRKIKGSVTRIWKDPNLKIMLVEISTYSSPDMPGIQRKITFLEDEINRIKKLDE